MNTVHIFVSTARFRSFAEMRDFIDENYTEDGDSIPSIFMREVGLRSYEPACIEAISSPHVHPLSTLLEQSSYSTQWLSQLPTHWIADSAICVYSPNVLTHPTGTSLDYVGAFAYSAAIDA